MTVNMTVKIKTKLIFNNSLFPDSPEMTEMEAFFSKNSNNLLINQYLKIKKYKKNCQTCHIMTVALSKINLSIYHILRIILNINFH